MSKSAEEYIKPIPQIKEGYYTFSVRGLVDLLESYASQPEGREEDKARLKKWLMNNFFESEANADEVVKYATSIFIDSLPPSKEQPEGVEEVQLCPKCQGQGRVSVPPWLPAEIHTWSGTQTDFECGVCNGNKLIPKYAPLPPSGTGKEEVALKDDRTEMTVNVPGEGVEQAAEYNFSSDNYCTKPGDTPQSIVDENFKGLDELIEDKDLLHFYKSLIATCIEDYAGFIAGASWDAKKDAVEKKKEKRLDDIWEDLGRNLSDSSKDEPEF